MRDSGRLAAAIETLTDFERRRVPLKIALADWARGARYAGARDRAWISGLCLDALRRRRSLAFAMADGSARAAALGALRWLWGRSPEEIEALAAEAPHGPGALSEGERSRILAPAMSRGGDEDSPGVSVLADFPEWLEPNVARVFEDRILGEMQAFTSRADVDLRINTLKTTPERAHEAVRAVGADPHPFLKTALRIMAPSHSERTQDVTVIPAFNKGWVEVQDLGSQIAAAAAGDIRGAQVLDYCAGGGGKTLALAALMDNRGQIYAYDDDARRLKPVYERARRAGVRNLQIINPLADHSSLKALEGRMDLVFVDAPCTGSGVWRRHPDSKWRLTPEQLDRRMSDQDAVLAAAAAFVRPGGRLVYVTCSIFGEENEDRVEAFLKANSGFRAERALPAIEASGAATPEGLAALAGCETPGGALRLTPARLGSDGFFIAGLRRLSPAAGGPDDGAARLR